MSKILQKKDSNVKNESYDTAFSSIENGVCFTKVYAETFEEMENGTAEQFTYDSQYGKVSYTFIKRLIQIKMKKKYLYDITTPYGYGGPILTEVSNLKLLMKNYFEAFHDYCVKNNIVSEFIRFHLFENQDVLNGFNGRKILIGSHIYRDLHKPLQQDLSSRVISEVRKAESCGLTVEFDYTGESQADFLKVYTETMNRNHAKDFYYIDDSFLNKLQKNLAGQFLYANAKLDGKVIASRLAFFDDRYGYPFLSGNLQDYYKYKTGTFLDYKLIAEMRDNGISHFIFGGGYQGEDGIYKYKKKFDKKGDIPFYVGGEIHMEEEYEYLTAARKEDGNYNPKTLFFPFYRAPMTNNQS